MEFVNITREKKLHFSDITDVTYFRIRGEIKFTPADGKSFTYPIHLDIDYWCDVGEKKGAEGYYFYFDDPEIDYNFPIQETTPGVKGREYVINQEGEEIKCCITLYPISKIHEYNTRICQEEKNREI